MRERLKLLVYYAGYWLTFQLLARAIFLIYNYDLTRELSAAEVLKVFLHGIRMDISMSGYWIMFTALMLTISMITTSRWPARLIHGINILALIVSSIVVVVDLELYRHWGFRLNTTPLFYVGSEALGSVDATVVIRLIAILMALVAGFLLLYFRYVIPRVKQVQPPTHRTSTLVLLGVTGAMILPIRGSLSVAPMNSGFVYFHKTKSYANHSAINATWNFLYSVQSDHNIEYPENFYDKTRSERYFSNLYATDDSTVNLLTSSKPNIVFFILESFTADVIEPLGGVKDVAPTLSKLCSEGVLFDNFYASGDRTDKGLVSILSGYPAQPRTSIIKYPAKTHHLPNLNHHLRKLGYHTSFIYGGDVDFANFRSYLTSCQF
ncbi:MAG: LTA synthase family protein, partial [Bacteroidota bacterium]